MTVSKKTIFLTLALIIFDATAYKGGSLLNLSLKSGYKTAYFTSMYFLTAQHIVMVVISTAASIILSVALGILATRSFAKNLLYPINLISSISQAFPPVAVLALAVSSIGFGLKPTIVALFIYGLFPIIQNTIGGIISIDKSIKDASRGMGMSELDLLLKVELPLAATSILAGVRTAVTINIGVAAIGAVVGAGGLGALIISGLINENQFFIAYGTIAVALLALLFDSVISDLEKVVSYRRS